MPTSGTTHGCRGRGRLHARDRGRRFDPLLPRGLVARDAHAGRRAVSLSRSLLAPSGTTAFASAMRAFCAAAAALGDSHALVCEALRPCLRRLQGAHREKGR